MGLNVPNRSPTHCSTVGKGLYPHIRYSMPFDCPARVNESPAISDAEMLGNCLRRARRACGLSQKKLAAKAGIDLATIQGLERGKGTVLPLLTVLHTLEHRLSDQPEAVEFGVWIAGRRKRAGFTQQTLAAHIGLSKPTVIQIERGRGNIRSLLGVFDALSILLCVKPQAMGDQPEVASYTIYEGDNLDHLKTLPDNSVDSVVTDPPYGISYMASEWDGSVPGMEMWKEVLRVLKPGGFLLSFGGTRTYHRMIVAVEDAGFEIRDQISWLYGQGMPKSRNVSKDIDRIQGAKREVVGRVKMPGYARIGSVHGVQTVNVTDYDILSNDPITVDAARFKGYGTGLKPAQEPIVVAQKPFTKKHATAKNVLIHGVGALNIDACRVANDVAAIGAGRFPANVIHDGSPEVLATFPHTKTGKGNRGAKSGFNGPWEERCTELSLNCGDEESAARYFFCAKPSAKERADNKHLTVKPVALMSHLVKLVTPVGGTVLDPYAGSGTTGVAAVKDGFKVILMERDERSVKTIRRRLREVSALIRTAAE